MMDSIAKLVSLSSDALAPQPPRWVPGCPGLDDGGARALASLLSRRNGFYAFESALHVFPAAGGLDANDANAWNAASSWRSAYEGLADGCFFFAQDIFGVQFCLSAGGVWTFDPETGEKEQLASSLDEWASLVLADYEMLTGYPIARDWQAIHGPLPGARRLVPKIPFVLGGEYSTDNLFALDAVRGMHVRAQLAVQIRDLPDGAQVRYELSE